MKRVILIFSLSCACLILLASVGLGVFLAVYDPNEYKQQIIAYVAEKTGKQLIFENDFQTRLFPKLGFSTGRVRLQEATQFGLGPALAAEDIFISLHRAPLLSGQAVIDTLYVHKPVVKIATAITGEHNWKIIDNLVEQTEEVQRVAPQGTTALHEAGDSAEAALPAFLQKIQLPIGEFTCADLQVMYHDMRNNKVYKTEIPELKITNAAFSTNSRLSLSGAFERDGAPYKIRFVAAGDVTVEPEGNVAVVLDEFSIKSDRVDQIFLALLAKMTISYAPDTRMYMVKNAQGTWAGSNFSGEGSFILPQKGVEGTLQGKFSLARLEFARLSEDIEAQALESKIIAAGAPNLTRVTVYSPHKNTTALGKEKIAVGAPAAAIDAAAIVLGQKTKEESSVPKAVISSPTITVDLDFAIAELDFLSLPVTESSLQIMGTTEKFTIPFNGKMQGGIVKGKVEIDRRKEPLKMHFSSNVAHVPVVPFAAAFSTAPLMEGRLDAQVTMSGVGATWKELAPTLKGTGQFFVKNGTIAKFTMFPKDILGVKNLPASLASVALSAKWKIDKGVASTNSIVFQSPTLSGKGGGTVHIVNEQADIAMDFKVRNVPPAIPIAIKGSIHALSSSVDRQMLSRNIVDSAIESKGNGF